MRPAYDLAVSNECRGAPAEFRLVREMLDRTAPLLNLTPLLGNQPRDVALAEVWSPVRMIHDEGAFAAELVPKGKGGADGSAGIASR